jgi:hypothetical protein
MKTLEERFDAEIKKRKFNFLELTGFQKMPKLAIKAGISIGYQMALNDFKDQINNLTTTKGPPE